MKLLAIYRTIRVGTICISLLIGYFIVAVAIVINHTFYITHTLVAVGKFITEIMIIVTGFLLMTM